LKSKSNDQKEPRGENERVEFGQNRQERMEEGITNREKTGGREAKREKRLKEKERRGRRERKG